MIQIKPTYFINAPTGRPPHVWTEEDKKLVVRAMKRVIEKENELKIGVKGVHHGN